MQKRSKKEISCEQRIFRNHFWTCKWYTSLYSGVLEPRTASEDFSCIIKIQDFFFAQWSAQINLFNSMKKYFPYFFLRLLFNFWMTLFSHTFCLSQLTMWQLKIQNFLNNVCFNSWIDLYDFLVTWTPVFCLIYLICKYFFSFQYLFLKVIISPSSIIMMPEYFQTILCKSPLNLTLKLPSTHSFLF